MEIPENLLPQEILSRATLRGKEYAWRLEDIPKVIAAARNCNLASVGGQLQFRFPEGGTCECYWIEVDTHQSLSSDLSWAERVALTSETALAEFQKLQSKWDFISEGRSAFGEQFEKWEVAGGDPAEAMCFVWYVATQAEVAQWS